MTKQQLVHTLKTHSVILQGRTALTGTGDKDCISRFPSFANEPNDETKTATNIGFCASWADGITINFFTNPSFSMFFQEIYDNNERNLMQQYCSVIYCLH